MRKEHLQQAEEAAAAAGHMGDMEKKIGGYFCELVSEWNPCYSDSGDARFQWDEEVGAHDVIATMVSGDAPERVNLRALLDRALGRIANYHRRDHVVRAHLLVPLEPRVTAI